MSPDPMVGKVVLVTGGGKGIGRETARLLGRMGAHVYICGRNEAALAATVESFLAEGLRAAYRACDVRDPESCRSLVEKIRDDAGRLDILVNNAGMSMRGSLERSAPEVLRAMVEINFLGAAYVTKYAVPLLRSSRGSVVFVSSLSALHGLPEVGAYGASKLALKALAESLRAELRGSGVHVGIVHVGFTENDPDKVVYRQDGSLVPLGKRKNGHTQRQVAERIVGLIEGRKREATLTALGRLAAFAFRFFPGLSDWAIERFAGRSGQYGSVNGDRSGAPPDGP